MKKYFLGDSFNVDKEGAGVLNVSFLIEGPIGVSGADGFF